MRLYLSGEGATDFGNLNQDKYQPGPLALLVDAFIGLKTNYSLLQTQAVEYVHKAELEAKAKTIKGRAPSKKNPEKETGYYYKNAKALVAVIQERQNTENDKQPSIAILFRDCDGTASSGRGECQAKYMSMKNGFEDVGFANGLPMLAKPKSEAWLICALKNYQHCSALENACGNDDSPNSLKAQLEQKLQQPPNRELLNQLVAETSIEFSQIDMPMLNQFKQECTELLENLGFR